MKEKTLLILLAAIIAVSIFFTYQRSFVWKNFELINSDEEVEEGVPEEAIDASAPEESGDIQETTDIYPQ